MGQGIPRGITIVVAAILVVGAAWVLGRGKKT